MRVEHVDCAARNATSITPWRGCGDQEYAEAPRSRRHRSSCARARRSPKASRPTELPSRLMLDAVVVGAGPNGLAAAITLAEAGRSVLVIEAADTVGGGTRSAELTLPGFVHDVCSAIHPLAVASPVFAGMPLGDHGLEWIRPPIALAHPLDDGSAALLHQDLGATGTSLDADATAWQRLFAPLARDWDGIAQATLGPMRIPHHPLVAARFGLLAVQPAAHLAQARFRGPRARALFAGMAAHAFLPLHQPVTAGFGLVLGALAHRVGWSLPRGGSQAIADALAAYFRTLGGELRTGFEVRSLDELPTSRVVLLDVTPRQFLRIAGDRLPSGYCRQLMGYRYGPGVCKIDWALDGPVPWTAPGCVQAGTVHVGGTLQEIEEAEDAVAHGRHPERPFVLIAQQSLFDDSRAPDGKHTLWGYCHVPNGSTVDMTVRIEAQLERFAPGFRDLVLARAVRTAAEMQAYNPNYVGGDINGGVQDLRQLFTRPAARLSPYTTPLSGVYLCSSSTPPGGGVHGLCGFFAAQAALRRP
jgi:phytoene dehydrogenase-like protein